MLIRIVSRHFQRENVETFLEIFSTSKDKIAASPGCIQLDLLSDKNDPCHYTTLSNWVSEEALYNYRILNYSKPPGLKPKCSLAKSHKQPPTKWCELNHIDLVYLFTLKKGYGTTFRI